MDCEACGHPLQVGDWPFCPHPRAAGQMGMLGEFKPYLDEHLDQTGKSHWVTSLGQRKQLMKQNSADYHAAGAGMPGCEV